ncbi:MAG: phage antirepressor N-terminal domain-containing protein [Bacteroides sp.]|nr:phage antirepressor N-terminal domain-containing protein [Bacteroides sp.]MCM1379985.1 phage antirepressor N-terminal domain-containing protein [Bacteroides sp.]MCM1446335.1 phage antirepressor N-terminal domain-containing protein [Prevotella sp.]
MSNKITIINGIEIIAITIEGETFVPVKPICEAIGVNYTSQLEKLQNDTTFAQSTVPLKGIVAADGKERGLLCSSKLPRPTMPRRMPRPPARKPKPGSPTFEPSASTRNRRYFDAAA